MGHTHLGGLAKRHVSLVINHAMPKNGTEGRVWSKFKREREKQKTRKTTERRVGKLGKRQPNLNIFNTAHKLSPK